MDPIKDKATYEAGKLIREDYDNSRDGGRAKWSTYRKAAKILKAAGE
jgi:hypothetical protein